MSTTSDLTLMYDKIHAVKVNQETIVQLKKNNNNYLRDIVVSNLRTGHDLVTNSTPKEIALTNLKIFVPWNKDEYDKAHNSINYLKINPDRLYFVTEKSITEVYFTDTLPVTNNYNLIANTDDEFTIELIFKSERVRNRAEIIYGNKYRFNFQKGNEKMTLRKLTE